MKACSFVFATITTIAIGCLNAQELHNGSFEDEDLEPTEAFEWEAWGNGWERVNRSSWAPVLDGEWMLAFKHWEHKSNADAGVSQDVKGVKQGESYRFVVRVFADVPEWGSLPKTVELRLESMIDGNTSIVASEFFEPGSMALNEWVDLEVSGVAPHDNLRALIVVNPSDQPGGALKFDLAELEVSK